VADKVLFVVFCWVWVGFGGLWQIRRGVVSYVEPRAAGYGKADGVGLCPECWVGVGWCVVWQMW